MRIVARYSFNNGKDVVQSKYFNLLTEIEQAVHQVDSSVLKTKQSKEKTMPGEMLYDPKRLNKDFKKYFGELGWNPVRVTCEYPTKFYVHDYTPPDLKRGAFREMDFVKEKLGVEVQFGKYSFMVYNVAAKMTIFSNLGYIDAGVEIVTVKAFANQMSSGV